MEPNSNKKRAPQQSISPSETAFIDLCLFAQNDSW